MWQEQFIDKIRQVVSGDPRVVGLFLAGSFGKGQADTYSDIDLLAVVARDDQAEFSGAWRQQLEKIAPIVFWNELGKEERVFNAITDQWQRIDLGVVDFTYLINEFIRVFGLLAVANGRGEYLLSVAGVDLLRMMLFKLLSEEVERADKGGMLAWSRRLSEEQLDLLATIPPAAPTRQSIIDAHLACASAFLPRARRMAERWEIEWPQRFEDATWRHLEREVGMKKPAGLM
ncbi:hypothetical protein GFL85_23780 [Rhizobium laguerreae]|uniref:nucleotidyltransferase domain-containing protein n=1 Tax=Rhizobium laguerreae TaxID=1076926 RepID=UPI00143F8D27|nr:hypothetical protein [Rhizobium laguerreae]